MKQRWMPFEKFLQPSFTRLEFLWIRKILCPLPYDLLSQIWLLLHLILQPVHQVLLHLWIHWFSSSSSTLSSFFHFMKISSDFCFSKLDGSTWRNKIALFFFWFSIAFIWIFTLINWTLWRWFVVLVFLLINRMLKWRMINNLLFSSLKKEGAVDYRGQIFVEIILSSSLCEATTTFSPSFRSVDFSKFYRFSKVLLRLFYGNRRLWISLWIFYSD